MNMADDVEGAASNISDREFEQFQGLLRRLAGIHLSPVKKALVCGRLLKRVRHHGLKNYGEYFRLLTDGREPQELQIAIDLLTTNETYFFREPKHFDFLRDRVLPSWQAGGRFRIWSAACSSGEEPYSIAMLLADKLGESAQWDITASDISMRVLERARSGHYAIERASHIPQSYLRNYCLKGIGKHEGTFLMDSRIRGKINFMQINLNAPLPNVGEFDVVFLRNVMIYFDAETKRQVVNRLIPSIKRGGYLAIGHSESLHGVCDALRPVMPSVYRKE